VCDNHKESSPVHGKICDPYIHDKALLDDRFSESLGSKLKDADLLGMPYQVIITKRSLGKRWGGSQRPYDWREFCG
jgi:prolyl-tRNA synthetase